MQGYSGGECGLSEMHGGIVTPGDASGQPAFRMLTCNGLT
jgi:hypothetical protein